MVSFTADATHVGTPERTWLPSLEELRLPAVPLGGIRRVVAVAPHPDDEVLGVGGVVRALAGRGASVTVVAVTGGEGSHPALDPGEVVRTRRGEAAAARRALGIDVDVVEAALPDGDVAGHEAPLERLLARVVAGADLVLAPWASDGHPDHEASGRAAVAAARASGTPLLAYPVWAWHWATPAGGELPLGSGLRHDLSADDLAAKRRAVAAFASQLDDDREGGAVLSPEVVARFTRSFEVLLRP